MLNSNKILLGICSFICVLTFIFCIIDSGFILLFITFGLVVIQAALICFVGTNLSALNKSTLLFAFYLIQDVGLILNPYDTDYRYLSSCDVYRLALLFGNAIAFVFLVVSVLIKNKNEAPIPKFAPILLFPVGVCLAFWLLLLFQLFIL